MDAIIRFLRDAPVAMLIVFIVLENVFIFVASLVVGAWLAKWFAHRPVSEAPELLSRQEIGLATSTVLLNSLVTIAGLFLWRRGIIQFRTDMGFFTVLLDLAFLVLVMDVCMYVLHRVAHIPIFFKIVHRTHHCYDNPRPLTLFVMNPLECLSFGMLWLLVVSIYHATWIGMSLYLAFNVAFGLLGHIGVEPFPDRWNRTPVLKYISTSSFHAGHHHEDDYNFGFYTLIWDRLFGTLAPRYDDDFAHQSSSDNVSSTR